MRYSENYNKILPQHLSNKKLKAQHSFADIIILNSTKTMQQNSQENQILRDLIPELNQRQPDSPQFKVFDNIIEDASWIDEFLNPEVLENFKTKSTVERVSEEEKHLLQLEGFSSNKESVNPRKDQFEKNPSSFHNVQKHLITYLRKVHIKKADFANHEVGVRAYELWKIFKNSKEYSKKCLYVAFGVSQGHNQQNLFRMASHCTQLNRILNKYSIKLIQRAQALLRQTIFKIVSETSKNAIKRQCKMHNFEEFYSYLTAFLVQLSTGEPSMRITKEQKEKAFKRQSLHPAGRYQ